MKKLLLSLLLIGGLIGIGFSVWHIIEENNVRHTETIYPEVGFKVDSTI